MLEVQLSPALRARVTREATQKPEVEGQKRKEDEAPPVALCTQEHCDKEDPRCEKGAHDDHLSVVLTRPGADPLLVSRHLGGSSYAAALTSLKQPHLS